MAFKIINATTLSSISTRRICMAFLLLLCACTREKAEKLPTVPVTAVSTQAAASNMTPVQVIKVLEQPFNHHVRATGKIVASQQHQLQFKTSSFVRSVLVKNGDLVEEGQLLAQLEGEVQQLELLKAKNEVTLKREAFNNLIVDFGGEFGNEETIKAGLREALRMRSGLVAAELHLREAQLNYSYTELRASQTGKVADLTIQAGNFISNNTPFCVLYTPRNLEVDLTILENELALVNKGQRAEVQVLAFPSRTYKAVVKEINPSVAHDGTVRIKLRLREPEHLYPGMNASVKILIPSARSIVVPKEAIVIRSARKVIFTEENGLAKWNYVTTGLENETEVEVVEGIDAGNRVIISNNLQLAHDSPVRVE